ncbi:hypothetical protein KBC31_03475 [Candidatus Saccharibacteria bacterium]|jgi:hypothetical protein|nr:hypothetical protein [Candidatus Saccharibacteria bacterium]
MDPNKPTYQFDNNTQLPEGSFPPPKKKMSKNLIIGLIVGGSILALIAIGAIFFIVSGKKSNSDTDITTTNNDDTKKSDLKKDLLPEENFDPSKAKEIIAASVELRTDSNWSFDIRDQGGVNRIVNKNSQCKITSKSNSAFSQDASAQDNSTDLLESRVEEIKNSVTRYRLSDVDRLQLVTNSNTGGATVPDAVDFIGKETRYDDTDDIRRVTQVYARQIGKFAVFVEVTCPTEPAWDSHAKENVSQAKQSIVQIQVEE